jgi:Na+-transporting NADH:ubiquinone oxidoreductase subunit NqrC
MKNSQKGFISLIILLIVVAAVAIGGGTYIYTKHQKSSTVTEKNREATSTNQNSVSATSTKSNPNNKFSIQATSSVKVIVPKINILTCLPSNIKLTDVVSVNAGGSNKITVDQQLKSDGAKCVNQKLLDKNGKEIRFYQLTGCWGNPPVNYRDIEAKQYSEITNLKTQYTLIEMTCNPSGASII